MIKTGAELLSAAALTTELVTLPNGSQVFIRELSLVQRTRFAEISKSAPQNAGAWLVAEACIDEAGHPLLTIEEALQAAETLSGQVIESIALAVIKLSGFSGNA